MGSSHQLANDFSADTLPQDPIEVVRILWQRKILVVLSLAGCISLGAAYWYVAPRIYESQAQILVIRTSASSIGAGQVETQGHLSYLQDYLSAHETLLKSPRIVSRAVEKKHLMRLNHLALEENVPRAIIKQLVVTRDFTGEKEMASAVLSLRYRATDSAESRTVLEAIIDSYSEYLEENDQDGTAKLRHLVAQWNGEIGGQLAQKKQEYQQLRQKTSDLVLKSTGGFVVSQDRLQSIAVQRLTYLVRKNEIEHQLDALDSARNAGVPQRILMDMVSRWTLERNSGTDPTYREQLLRALGLEKALSQQFGPGHPHVELVREQIRLIQNMHQGTDSAQGASDFVDPVESFQEGLRRELAVVTGTEASLSKMLQDEHEKARIANAVSGDLDDLRTEIASLQELQKGLIKQVHGLDFAKDSGMYASQVIAAPELGLQVAPNALLVAAIAIVTGGVLGAIFVFIVEILDQSFRSADEIHRKLGLPLLGILPYIRHARSDNLPAYHSPDSIEADVFRAVRIGLGAAVRNDGLQVLQLVGAKSGDGTSILAANLAVSVAQSGRKVLLMDANLRHSRDHQFFGVTNETGLSSVLSGQTPLNDAIIQTEIPRLSLLASGPQMSNVAELIGSIRFRQCLDQLRARFDLILIDTPAVLEVTDGILVAQNVDGVVLVLKNTRGSRFSTEHAVGALKTAGATLLGIVCNAPNRRTALANNGGATYGLSISVLSPGRNSTEANRREVARCSGSSDPVTGLDEVLSVRDRLAMNG